MKAMFSRRPQAGSGVAAVLATLLLVFSQWAMALPEGAVNINTADAAELAAALNGVGASRAEAIVAYRTEYGPFQSVEELLEVSGIGERVLESNREKIAISE